LDRAPATPVPAPATAPAPLRARHWLGAGVSALCFVHCVGVALLAPLLPAVLGPLATSEPLEWGLWLLCAGLAIGLAAPRRRVLPPWSLAVGGAGLLLGPVGLVGHVELAIQASLGGLVVLQGVILRQRILEHRRRDPGCCDG
jgi:hypothetical protein